MSTDIIFERLQWRNIEIKNRILRSSISGRWDNEDGSLSQVRVNWETRFAEGGVGAIISSFVPVLMEGRILPNYATIHDDRFIEGWRKVGEAVHKHDCKFILQLSHSGRQMDLQGLSNKNRKTRSSTNSTESINGILTQAMTQEEIDYVVQAFAKGAERAKKAGLDGVELHGANGYLITQFLSSGINDRIDGYGGDIRNRARFLLEIIAAIRDKCGPDFHLQVKFSGIDHNNVSPFEKKEGNRLEDSLEVARMVEAAGADAIHVSTGSTFPHPLNPPGQFDYETIRDTYGTMLSAGVHTLRNYLLFRHALFGPLFKWYWERKGRMWAQKPNQGRLSGSSRYMAETTDNTTWYEGVGLEAARAIKKVVSIPVISTGGYQRASFVRDAISSGAIDAVSIARSLIANPDLPKQWALGLDVPAKPCSYCNKCLLNAPANPLGCYDLNRFDGDYDKLRDEILSIYKVQPNLVVP